MGYNVLVVWQCTLTAVKINKTLDKLEKKILTFIEL